MLGCERPRSLASCAIVFGSLATEFKMASFVPFGSNLFWEMLAHGSLYSPCADTHSQGNSSPLYFFELIITPLYNLRISIYANSLAVNMIYLNPLNISRLEQQ